MLLTVNHESPPVAPPRSGTFHAVVRAGDSVTPYVRMGSGKPVLILRQSGRQSALWSSVLTNLASGFRVMMPEVSPDLGTLLEWFETFHDGLGIGPVRIVADERYGIAVLRLALLHRERVDRVVILSERDGGPELDGTLIGEDDSRGVLFLTHDRPAPELLDRTMGFLRDTPE